MLSTKEEAELRAVYRSWPNERLAQAVTREQADYRPEAIGLMRQELELRGVSPEAAATIVEAQPLPRLQKQDRLFPRSLTRIQYFKRWLIWVGCIFCASFVPSVGYSDGFGAFAAVLIIGLIYRVVALDIPRMRDAGMHPALLLLALIPGVGFVLQLMLFFMRSNKVPVR